MRIVTETTSFSMDRPSCVAIGKFDGVHVGHMELLRHMLDAKQEGLATVVFTFTPSPYEYFTGEKMAELTTTAEKRRLFEKLGVDVMWEFPMNQWTATMSPDDYIRNILVKQLRAGLIIAGSDLSFGDKGAGDVELLRRYADIYDYDISVIEKVCIGGSAVSSTYVRNEVRAGHMETVEVLLGKPYSFCGEVCHGRHLGHTLGMPTVNLIPEEGKLLPPFGVYYSYVVVGGKTYSGITNIGKKPTVSDEEKAGIETYLYNFQEEIYGNEIEVQLLSYKRPEEHFADVEALKAQLQQDREDGMLFFEKKNHL